MQNNSSAKTTRVTFAIVSLVYLAFAMLLMAFFSQTHTLAQCFALFTYQILAGFVVLYSLDFFFRKRPVTILGVANAKLFAKLFATCVVAGLCLEFCTIASSPIGDPLSLADWSKKRCLFFILSAYCLELSCLATVKRTPLQAMRAATGSFKVPSVSTLLKTILVTIALPLGAALLLRRFAEAPFIPTFALFVVLGICCRMLIGDLTSKRFRQERAFLLASLLFGGYLCIATPVTTGISWDDQIHYDTSVAVSYLFDPQYTETEMYFSETAVRRSQEGEALSLSEWTNRDIFALEKELNENYRRDLALENAFIANEKNTFFTLSSIGNAPSAIGLWIGRLLNLPFSTTIILGRLFNLLFYATICYKAIKVAPAKKTLFMLVALIPTNVFLASNYSYDPWLNSLILLGTALFLREAWSDGDLLLRRMIPCAAVFFAGLVVKPVYFPLLGLLLLMPKNKFASKSQRARYYALTILLALFVLASFAAPFLSSIETNPGDLRGGSNVNPLEQVSYILEDPLRYAGMLTNFFLSEYLSPLYGGAYTASFAYLGRPFSGIAPSDAASFTAALAANALPIVILTACAILDGNRTSRKYTGALQTLWAVIVFVSSITLVATSMYVIFTPVGLSTVNGCQHRYLLPVVAPTLALAFNNKTPLKMNGEKCALAFFAIALLELTLCIFINVTSKFA